MKAFSSLYASRKKKKSMCKDVWEERIFESNDFCLISTFPSSFRPPNILLFSSDFEQFLPLHLLK